MEWSPEAGLASPEAVSGFDAIVHLAGENIAAGRWNRVRRRQIRSSRGPTTRRLIESFAGLAEPPRVFVCASAVGWYGDRGDELLTESSPPGRGFLPLVCREWEEAAAGAGSIVERVVSLRLGVVLSVRGGALARMLPLFRLGLGGRLGSGRQYFPWIHLDDAVAAILHLVAGESSGVVNLVAPEQTTNAEFTRCLAKTLGRPAILPAPRSALVAVFGSMVREALLASTRVAPERLVRSGFSYAWPRLDDALRHELRP